MCLSIYFSSHQPLARLSMNPSEPQLWVNPVQSEGVREILSGILSGKHLYEVGSFMGCSCGLAYGDWSVNKLEENHQKRRKDVGLFFDYLKEAATQNELEVFGTMWEVFPPSFPTQDFEIPFQLPNSFELPEEIILKIRRNHI